MNAASAKTTSFHWDGYGLMEYLLVLHPSEPVNQKIQQEKQDFYRQYGEKIAVKTRPHITIGTFLAKEAMEDTLNRWINNICNLHGSFELTLNNYSGFPPDTIYLRIQDLKPVLSLIQQLKILDNYIRLSDCPPLKPSPKPHLTLAKKLPMEIFEKAIKEYSRKDFHESFIARELVLLKRSHEFEACKVVNKFPLLPGTNN